MTEEKKYSINNTIVLAMLPYWTPLVPPQGIAHLKTFLQHHGYRVVTADANTDKRFKRLYDQYFAVLARYVPKEKQGNFFNIGHDVLRNHMLAHIHAQDQALYRRLVADIVLKTFYTNLDDGGVLELNGVLDQFYERMEEFILELLERENPGVLGLSVLRDTIGPSLFAFRLAKEKFPHIKTIMGGAIFSDHLLKDTPNFEYFLERAPYIDNIVIGEGQNLILKLLNGELPEGQRVFTLADIDRQVLGFSPENTPDMDDFDVKGEYPYLAAQASGSCPYQCSFCNVAAFYGEYRQKDPKQAVREMIGMYRKYGKQVFFMNDSLLNYVAGDLADQFLESGVALYWDGYLRVDENVCDIDTTIHWRRGGMYRVRLGVESGSQHVLDMMDKKITPALTEQTLSTLAMAGIKTTTYWVIGHPGETEEDFQQTLDLLERLKNVIYEAECNPFIYGYGGQAATDQWREMRQLLYPDWAKEMLVLQTWIVDADPTREVAYDRVNRFVRRCEELGIPNPYSINDIFNADTRWQKLHKNAVPNLLELNDESLYIDECKHIQPVGLLQKTLDDDGDFDF